MTNVLLILAATYQAAFTPPPAPAPQVFDQARANFAERLRRSCISEPGIASIIEDWSRNQRAPADGPTGWRTLQRNVAEAVYGDPVDMARVERALRAEARDQADRTVKRAEAAIVVLRKLSPSDRAIYARDFTVMQPTKPAKACVPPRK